LGRGVTLYFGTGDTEVSSKSLIAFLICSHHTKKEKESMNFRKMNSGDVPVTFEIAILGREKSYTREALAAVGITEESTVELLDVSHSHEGWVCECDGKVVGTAMANKNTGELWVVVVLPEYERRGIGSKLYATALEWLVSLGWKEAWLAVLPKIQVTGYSFFKKRGWRDDEMRGDFRIMKKSLVAPPAGAPLS
jgi:GNAT superfamily N-acetyltransferase